MLIGRHLGGLGQGSAQPVGLHRQQAELFLGNMNEHLYPPAVIRPGYRSAAPLPQRLEVGLVPGFDYSPKNLAENQLFKRAQTEISKDFMSKGSPRLKP
jgi:hypothetical protein